MIPAAGLLTVLSIGSAFLPASIDRVVPGDGPDFPSSSPRLPSLRGLVGSTTECIAQTVSTDPRYQTLATAGEMDGILAVNELIVESVPQCLTTVHRLIDEFDRLFGKGSGEQFFMGPFLDDLPQAVQRVLRQRQLP